MPQNARTELDNLLQGQPTRGAVQSPATPRIQVLPLNDLSWEDFERLCARLVAKDHDILASFQIPHDGGRDRFTLFERKTS